MEFVLVPLTALAGALLTFFSGFGLGTLLLPVFLLFFPIQEAILLTAIVHLLNNLFKGVLTGRSISIPVLLRFGIPSVAGAWLGAWLLGTLGESSVWIEYSLMGHTCSIRTLNILIGLLLLLFTLFEVIPALENLEFPAAWMIPGGILSGFFGGLSGHQGALRSAFLVRAGLSKETFIATGTAIAIGVDLTRISRYLFGPEGAMMASGQTGLIVVAVLFAFAGSWFGKKLLSKTTIGSIQKMVALFMAIIGVLTLCGIIA